MVDRPADGAIPILDDGLGPRLVGFEGIYVLTLTGKPIAWFCVVDGNMKSALEMAQGFVLQHFPTEIDTVRYTPGKVMIEHLS